MKPEKIIIPIIVIAALGFVGYWLWKKYGFSLFNSEPEIKEDDKSKRKYSMRGTPPEQTKNKPGEIPVQPSTGGMSGVKKEMLAPTIDKQPSISPVINKPTAGMGMEGGPMLSIKPTTVKPPSLFPSSTSINTPLKQPLVTAGSPSTAQPSSPMMSPTQGTTIYSKSVTMNPAFSSMLNKTSVVAKTVTTSPVTPPPSTTSNTKFKAAIPVRG